MTDEEAKQNVFMLNASIAAANDYISKLAANGHRIQVSTISKWMKGGQPSDFIVADVMKFISSTKDFASPVGRRHEIEVGSSG